MAAHAYKRAVEDLDTGVARELVRPLTTQPSIPLIRRLFRPGLAIPDMYHGAAGKNECILPRCKRTHQQAEQESA